MREKLTLLLEPRAEIRSVSVQPHLALGDDHFGDPGRIDRQVTVSRSKGAAVN